MREKVEGERKGAKKTEELERHRSKRERGAKEKEGLDRQRSKRESER